MFLTKEKKSPYWHVVYKNESGRRIKESTKKRSRAEAEQYLDELKEKLNFNAPWLTEFKKEYIEFMSYSYSDNYVRTIQSSFHNLICYAGNKRIDKYDVRILEKFVHKSYSTAKAAAALYYRTLKAAFNKAESWNYIKENPFKKIKAPKLPQSYPVFINHSQLDKIIFATNRKIFKSIFKLGFHTGMRLGEIVNLRWKSINLQNRIITVSNSNGYITKNKRERTIPINNTLFKMFNREPINYKADDFVFSQINGKRFLENHISKQFKKSVRLAGLDEAIHFHSLRHSFASNLVQKGVSLNVVKELLGHEDIKTTEIYSHLLVDNLVDAVKKLDNENYE